MARNDNHHPDRQERTSGRIRDAITAAVHATTVFAHFTGLHEVTLIAHLGTYGLHLVDDGLPRTPATGTLTLLDTASMCAHLLGLHEASLILHLSGCALRLLLHPRIAAAVRSWATRLAHHAVRIAHRGGRALASTYRRMRNQLRRNR